MNIKNSISRYFGQRDISSYPELYHKNSQMTNLNFRIAIANSAVLHDVPGQNSSINWKLI